MNALWKDSGASGRAREIDPTDLSTKIKHLRKHYGKQLAPDWDGERTLGELLKETRFASLTQYVRHHGRKPASEV